MSFDIDFSPIGNLARTYDEARTRGVRERTLAELGRHFADGTIDYRGLGAKLFAIGEPRPGLAALQAAEQRDGRVGMMPQLNAQGVPQQRPAMALQAATFPQRAAPAQTLWPFSGLPLAPGMRHDRGWYAPVADWPK
jgi:hypothetical protein